MTTGAPMSPTSKDASTTRLPGRRLLAAAGLFLLLVGVVAGLAVTSIGAANTGELALDVTISQHRDTVLTSLARFINVGLGPMIAPLVLLLGCAIAWRRSRFVAVSVAGLTIVGWLSVEAGKALVNRPRPPAATVHALVSETAADSYPSGHTAFAAAAVFAIAATVLLARRRARLVWLIGIPLIVLVAASRLYLGVHYLSDVAASVVFASGSVLIAISLAGPRLLRIRDRDESRRTGLSVGEGQQGDDGGAPLLRGVD